VHATDLKISELVSLIVARPEVIPLISLNFEYSISIYSAQLQPNNSEFKYALNCVINCQLIAGSAVVDVCINN